jgi:hypothetical protein
LKHSANERSLLAEKNQQYKDLIEVKTSFLLQVQELLVQCIQQKSLSNDQHEQMAEVLSYLNSVLLLAEKTLAEDSTQK